MVESKIKNQLAGQLDSPIYYYWVPLNKISQNMQLAVIAAEDQQFPNHFGFDIKGIEKALIHNQKSGRIRGGSTISQQTVKNLYLWSGRSWIRKGLEVPFTVMVEGLWTKKRILNTYLNIAEFGRGIFGVEAASLHYFAKHASQLTRNESALLAAVLPNPIYYRVKNPSSHVKAKQRWILKQMTALGGDRYLRKLNE